MVGTYVFVAICSINKIVNKSYTSERCFKYETLLALNFYCQMATMVALKKSQSYIKGKLNKHWANVTEIIVESNNECQDEKFLFPKFTEKHMCCICTLYNSDLNSYYKYELISILLQFYPISIFNSNFNSLSSDISLELQQELQILTTRITTQH